VNKLALLATILTVFLQPTAASRAADAPAQPPFELKDGDRVVFVGGTFMERESQFGYIETMLTTRFPDRNVTFRNLGYAGDTVGVEARRICSGWAVFGGPDDGFNRLTKLIQEIKPTVVFAAYGMGESFDGEAKLPEFVAKYNRLLDMLTSNSGIPAEQVRVVLIGPNYHEKVEGMPDPAEHNKQIEMYSGAIAGLAKTRNARFVDLCELHRIGISRPGMHSPWTSNGIHPTVVGNAMMAQSIESSLFGSGSIKVMVNVDGDKVTATGAKVVSSKRTDRVLKVEVTLPRLCAPSVMDGESTVFPSGAVLTVRGLPEGSYRFTFGDGSMEGLSAADLVRGMPIAETKQVDDLRKLIVAKNFDYFNYFRPQNDTYILGYRKKEQGRNAVEIPQFKPLVEAKEKEIAKLRVPQPVPYTLEKQ
jgi:hypothetical protein